MSFSVSLAETGTFDAWRQAAKSAISHHIEPQHINWAAQNSLFIEQPLPDACDKTAISTPKAFLDLAHSIVWHSDPERFYLLYEALWRIVHRDGNPLSPVDALGIRLSRMAKNVRRDLHKMHAFLRFREIEPLTERRRFAAWFEPDHNIVEPASSFFVARFSDMDWSILTPQRSVNFENGKLSFQPGAERPNLSSDATEALWATYFTHIFNPARTNARAMLSEMPKKYWKNLPETNLIPEMLKNAEARVGEMREAQASTPRKGAARISERYRVQFETLSDNVEVLDDLQKAIRQCTRCNLCEHATQAVCGAGAEKADLMIVGEQPGDQEDLNGQPFVGPAGQLLRRLMHQAHIAHEHVWLTNAVKHFKFMPRGKRRLHQTPNRDEINHCRWWLRQEITLIKPRVILALGASAAFALTEINKPLSERRGRTETTYDGTIIKFSWHPAYILRVPDKQRHISAEQELLADLVESFHLTKADALHMPQRFVSGA